MIELTGLLLFIVSLAAFRITRFLTRDTLWGPVRRFFMRRWLTNPDHPTERDVFWHDAITCDWCIGAYVSGALVGGLSQIVSVPLPGLVAIAVSGIVGLLGTLDRE